MRFIILSALAILLAACASKKPDIQNTSCANNAYLQRYDCSLSAMQQAAMQGDADAQYGLGYMYYYGVDTAVDKGAAKIWINKAAAQGQPLALQAQTMLDKQSIPGSGSATMKNSKKVAPKKHFSAQKVKQHSPKPSAKKTRSDEYHNNLTYKKLRDCGANAYVLQLMASHNLKDVQTLQHAFGYKDSYVYTKRQGGKLWNVLVYGRYKSYSAARQAIAKLPANLQQLKPWPVRCSTVLKQIRAK